MITKDFLSFSENVGNRNLFNYAIRSFIHEGGYIENFNDRDLEEILLSRKALKNAETKTVSNKKNEDTNTVASKIKVNQKLSMVDLETALSYILRREIPRIPEIRGESFDALSKWLTVLTKVSIFIYTSMFEYFSIEKEIQS